MTADATANRNGEERVGSGVNFAKTPTAGRPLSISLRSFLGHCANRISEFSLRSSEIAVSFEFDLTTSTSNDIDLGLRVHCCEWLARQVSFVDGDRWLQFAGIGLYPVGFFIVRAVTRVGGSKFALNSAASATAVVPCCQIGRRSLKV